MCKKFPWWQLAKPTLHCSIKEIKDYLDAHIINFEAIANSSIRIYYLHEIVSREKANSTYSSGEFMAMLQIILSVYQLTPKIHIFKVTL